MKAEAWAEELPGPQFNFVIHLLWPQLFIQLCYTPFALVVDEGKIKTLFLQL